jgi:hypothetical protein
MSHKKGLLSSGWGRVARNKRYIFWFWLLNLTLAEFGTAAFRKSAHAILDHSMAADRLLHGFDLAVMIGLFARPEFGSMAAMSTVAGYFAFLFLLFTALFLPGIFQGYASTYRLPREDFFRACGRNLWRFIRLMIVAGIVMLIFTIALFLINGALVKKAGESTNEVLPFEVNMAGLTVIFLVMTTLRIWFDLAEADIVLNDQRAVRKSIGAGFRHTFRGLGRLLTSYVAATILAAIILVGGLWIWMKMVAPDHWFGAFIVSQLILLMLLVPRFWQRGIAVSYWQQHMLVPVVAVKAVIFESTPVAAAVPAGPPSAAPEGA